MWYLYFFFHAIYTIIVRVFFLWYMNYLWIVNDVVDINWRKIIVVNYWNIMVMFGK